MERLGLSPELIENIGKAVRQFFDDLPDGWEPGIGMIALLQIAADNTQFDKEEISRVVAHFLTMQHETHAEVIVHHNDGSKRSFVGPDFHLGGRSELE